MQKSGDSRPTSTTAIRICSPTRRSRRDEMISRLSLLSTLALTFATGAQADLSISNKPTQNITCDAGVCTATAQKAVLNANDLQAMLASGDTVVKTGTLA